jgi:hypothetical protein
VAYGLYILLPVTTANRDLMHLRHVGRIRHAGYPG